MLLSQWRTPVAGALGALLLGGQIAQAVELDLTSTGAFSDPTVGWLWPSMLVGRNR